MEKKSLYLASLQLNHNKEMNKKDILNGEYVMLNFSYGSHGSLIYRKISDSDTEKNHDLHFDSLSYICAPVIVNDFTLEQVPLEEYPKIEVIAKRSGQKAILWKLVSNGEEYFICAAMLTMKYNTLPPLHPYNEHSVIRYPNNDL